MRTLNLAGGLGFEPRLAESESAVLPLDDPPMKREHFNRFVEFVERCWTRITSHILCFSPLGHRNNSMPCCDVKNCSRQFCRPRLAESESAVLPLDDPPAAKH